MDGLGLPGIRKGRRAASLRRTSIYESEKSESVSCSFVSETCDSMNCSPPGSSIHGILQARILEWVSHSLLAGIFLTQGSNLNLGMVKQTCG